MREMGGLPCHHHWFMEPAVQGLTSCTGRGFLGEGGIMNNGIGCLWVAHFVGVLGTILGQKWLF